MRLERYLSPRFAPLACEVAFRLRLAWPYHVRWLADRLGDSSCDKKFGIASAKRQSLAKLGLELPDCADYQPVSYVDFQKFFESLPIGSNDVLLDFGSGMGRALCLAATYPFRSVIGVEMSPELCASCELPPGSSYGDAAEMLMKELAEQTSLSWPDEFPRKLNQLDPA